MNKKTTLRAALPAPLTLFLAIACTIPAGAAPAQMGGSGGMMSMPPAAMVLQQMHMVNLFEIKAAAVARKKANAMLVKRYADRLWQDHHVADSMVKNLANRLGFKLKSPAEMRQMMMKMKTRMMQQSPMMGSSGTQTGRQMSMQQNKAMGQNMPMQSGKPMQKMQKMMQMTRQIMIKLHSVPKQRFDRTYIMAMIKTHKKAIHMLEKVKSKDKVKKPQVMHLVNKLLPILKQHLKLAQDLQNGMAS